MLLSSFHPPLLLLTSSRHPKEVQAGMFYAEGLHSFLLCVALSGSPPFCQAHPEPESGLKQKPSSRTEHRSPVYPWLQPLPAVASSVPAPPAAEKRGWVRSPTPASSPGSPAASASRLPLHLSHTHARSRAHVHIGNAASTAPALGGSPPL